MPTWMLFFFPQLSQGAVAAAAYYAPQLTVYRVNARTLNVNRDNAGTLGIERQNAGTLEVHQ
jgi:hypothetical protein